MWFITGHLHKKRLIKEEKELQNLVNQLSSLKRQHENQLNAVDWTAKRELITHKELMFQFNENALRLLVTYPIDNISCIVEKGHELFLLEKEINQLKREHEHEAYDYEMRLASIDEEMRQIKSRIAVLTHDKVIPLTSQLPTHS
jgi:hypothetical protein